MLLLFFFFKQKTAYEMRISDWSSDVCSSDLSHLAGIDCLCCRQQMIRTHLARNWHPPSSRSFFRANAAAEISSPLAAWSEDWPLSAESYRGSSALPSMTKSCRLQDHDRKSPRLNSSH